MACMTFTFSLLKDALIPFKNELMFSATLPTVGVTNGVTPDEVEVRLVTPGLGSDSAPDACLSLT